jgi:hypothetical protein
LALGRYGPLLQIIISTHILIVNRWISIRFNMLSSIIIGITAVVILLNTNIDASYAGLAMTFIMGLTGDILFLVRRFVSLEQSMVAVSFRSLR